MGQVTYIHGTNQAEQARLADLNRLTNKPFINFLQLRPGDAVLEIGSGLGILAREVAARVPHGRVVGMEYSAEQLAAVKVAAPNLSFRPGDAHRLELPDNSFDVVYCRYLLEHVADPGMVLAEMRRVLKPGGKFFVQENDIAVNVLFPECPAFDRVWKKFAELQQQLGGDALIGKKLFALCTKAGFRNVAPSIVPEVHAFGSDDFAAWVHIIIGNLTGARQHLLERGLVGTKEMDDAIRELEQFQKNPEACGWFYWNRVTAEK
jgi:ubiquinone/menaquinone biosynthesis C-methylase UbiE